MQLTQQKQEVAGRLLETEEDQAELQAQADGLQGQLDTLQSQCRELHAGVDSFRAREVGSVVSCLHTKRLSCSACMPMRDRAGPCRAADPGKQPAGAAAHTAVAVPRAAAWCRLPVRIRNGLR